MPSNPELLTTAEAATRLGISPGRVRQLIVLGALPAVKRGRDQFILAADVEAYKPRAVGRPRKEEEGSGR